MAEARRHGQSAPARSGEPADYGGPLIRMAAGGAAVPVRTGRKREPRRSVPGLDQPAAGRLGPGPDRRRSGSPIWPCPPDRRSGPSREAGPWRPIERLPGPRAAHGAALEYARPEQRQHGLVDPVLDTLVAHRAGPPGRASRLLSSPSDPMTRSTRWSVTSRK